MTRRRLLLFCLKFAVSAGILWFLLGKIEPRSVGMHLKALSFVTYAILALLFALQIAIAIVRWRRILGNLGLALDLKMAAKFWLEGAFFGQALPSVVGGDAVRVLRVGQYRGHMGIAALSVMADRGAGLVALCLFAMLAPVLFFDRIPWERVFAIDAGYLPYFSGVAVLLVAIVAWFLLSPKLDSLRGRLRAAVSHFGPLARFGNIAAYMSFSFAVGMLSVLQVFVLCRDVGVGITLLQSVALVPFCLLVQVLPVSLAGWGIREGAMVAVFGLLGVPAEHSIAVSVAYGIAVLLSCLPGGLMLFYEGAEDRV